MLGVHEAECAGFGSRSDELCEQAERESVAAGDWPPAPPAATGRRWPDLSAEEQERVKRLLTPDPDDNLDDLLARMRRAQEIIEGTKP